MADLQLTPMGVVEHLSELTRKLDNAVSDLAEADLDAVQKRHLANLAESMAFVKAEGPQDLRRHLARITATELELDAVVAESAVRHLRTQIRARELEIEVGRSYGATVRAEMAALPYDPRP